MTIKSIRDQIDIIEGKIDTLARERKVLMDNLHDLLMEKRDREKVQKFVDSLKNTLDDKTINKISAEVHGMNIT